MSVSDVTIESQEFSHVYVTSIPSHKSSDGEEVDCTIKSELTVSPSKTDPFKFLVTSRVTFNLELDPKYPYAIDVGSLCRLTVGGSMSDQERREIAAKTAHEVSFPAIREIVSTLTARQPWGIFSLGLSTLDTSDKNNQKNDQTEKSDIRPKRIRKKAAVEKV